MIEEKTVLEKVGKYIVLNGLDSDSRKQELVDKRCYLYKYLKENTELSLSGIGRMFDRDHSTIIHGINVYDQIKESNSFYRNTIDLHEEFPLDFRKPLTIDLGTIKLPYKIYDSVKRRNKKKKHLSMKETVIDILING